jgi:hypothetical protein
LWSAIKKTLPVPPIKKRAFDVLLKTLLQANPTRRAKVKARGKDKPKTPIKAKYLALPRLPNSV